MSLGPIVQAQGLFGMRQRHQNQFKSTQWYIGFTTGATHSRAVALENHSEFSLINNSLSTDKEYQILHVPAGYSAGISTAVSLTANLQVSLTAKYNNLKYGYQQQYHWLDPENEENQLSVSDLHTVSLGYLELPFQIRYSFPIPIRRFKPFVQTGLVYGRLLDAHKKVVSQRIDYASGGSVQSISSQQTAKVSDSYIKSKGAYTLGGGVIYNFGGLMVLAEANYQQGLHTITNAKTRYTATRHLTGLGNVPDDINLHVLSYSVSFLFPLKFLTDKNFKPVIF